MEPLRIAAEADGVHLNVVNETSDAGTYLTHDGGGEPAPQTPTAQVMTFPPDAHDFSCAHSPDMTADEAVTLLVADPHDYYDEVDAEAVLDCALTSMAAPGPEPSIESTTGKGAAEAWIAANAPNATLTLAAGYRDDPQRWYLFSSETQRGVIEIWTTGPGRFTANLGHFC